VGLGTWMVTRRDGDELAVVAAHGDGVPVAPGPASNSVASTQNSSPPQRTTTAGR